MSIADRGSHLNAVSLANPRLLEEHAAGQTEQTQLRPDHADQDHTRDPKREDESLGMQNHPAKERSDRSGTERPQGSS